MAKFLILIKGLQNMSNTRNLRHVSRYYSSVHLDIIIQSQWKRVYYLLSQNYLFSINLKLILDFAKDINTCKCKEY